MWLLVPVASAQSTFPVTDATGLSAALLEAAAGDTIELAPGAYQGHFVVPPGVRLYGPAGPAATVVHENDANVLTLSGAGGAAAGPTVIEGLTIDGVRYVNGAGNLAGARPVYTAHDTVLLDVVLEHGFADYGGTVRVADAVTVRVERSVLTDGYGVYAGGHLYVDGSTAGARVELVGSTLETAYASSGGAAWLEQAEVWIEESVVQGNEAGGPGAGLYLDNCATDVVRSVLADNDAFGNGGAVYATGRTFEARASTVSGNDGRNGAGLFLQALAATLDDVALRGNDADLVGGGAHLSDLREGSLVGVAIEGNTGTTGAGLAIDGGDAPIAVTRARLCSNQLVDDPDETEFSGGAMWIRDAEVEVTSSLLLENLALGPAAGVGGGVEVVGAATVALHNDVFAFDQAATVGSAVSVAAGASVDLRNTLVAWGLGGQAVRDESAKPGLVVAYDAFFENGLPHTAPESLLDGPGNLVDVDPGLGPVDEDACTLEAWRPLPGSPLVDAGDPAITDPDGTRSDIGLFGGPDSPDPLDGDGDGVPDAADCAPGDGAVFPGAPEVCNGIDDDCDLAIDAADPDCDAATDLAADGDGDGYAPVGATLARACPADGWVALVGDCDDADAATFPGAVEDAAPADRDCDGVGDLPGRLARDCACATGRPGVGAALAAALLVSARRRRRAAGPPSTG